MSLVSDLMGGAGINGQAATYIGTQTVDRAPTKTVATGLTATGTTITDALQLTRQVNVISTAAASTGVKLPPLTQIGSTIIVQNNGANAINLFPPTSTGTLNGGSAGAAVTTAAAAGASCTRLSATDWLVNVTAKES